MYGKAIGVILSMTEEIASQEIDFMEYGDTQINTINMERGQRKDLIGEMPVGIAVVRGGNELYIEMVNREFLHAEGYDREELTGNTPFVEYLYRDDTGCVRGCHRSVPGTKEPRRRLNCASARRAAASAGN